MKELVIGNTILEYTVRVSHKAKHKRVEVTPERIEVIVPRETPPEAITDFVEEKKNNIFTSFIQIKNKLNTINDYEPAHYVSGAKVLYHGRMELLNIEKYNGNKVNVSYKNGFYIHYPDCIPEKKRDEAIKTFLEQWMIEKIEADAQLLVKLYGEKLGLFPAGIKIKEQKHLWASCGKDGIININWQLVRFPEQIFEYVVTHELCHLKFRNHSKEFWMLLGSVMPEYEQYKVLLDKFRDYTI